jgi:hypothetical protein
VWARARVTLGDANDKPCQRHGSIASIYNKASTQTHIMHNSNSHTLDYLPTTSHTTRNNTQITRKHKNAPRSIINKYRKTASKQGSSNVTTTQHHKSFGTTPTQKQRTRKELVRNARPAWRWTDGVKGKSRDPGVTSTSKRSHVQPPPEQSERWGKISSIGRGRR